MFELPDAKRVRREDLGESSDDEGADHDEQQNADLLAKLHARMAGMLDLGDDADADAAPTETTEQQPAAAATSGETAENDVKEDEPEEFEFRLFTTSNPATKIALVDEDERAMAGDGAMIRKRPLSYYIAGEPTPEVKAELAFAAVSGEEVLKRAQRRWWGMEQPWRVTTTSGTRVSSKGTAGTAAAAAGGDAGKTKKEADAAVARRRRPGKKKRLAIRVKQRERVKKAEELEKFKAGKEEALKEKKKRLNRLKKLRKRAKAKEGKNGGGEGGGDGGESGSGSDGDE